MSSAALVHWRSVRTARLERLAGARLVARDPRADVRWADDQLGRWLILLLAGEFQGFCRDLHDEAIQRIVTAVASSDHQLQHALSAPYRAARRLNRGNADPGVLGHDFSLLGIRMWADLRARYPSRASQLRSGLELFHEARNGIAHDDAERLARVMAAGWPPTLSSVRRWQKGLDDLSTAMDHIVGDRLESLLNEAPW